MSLPAKVIDRLFERLAATYCLEWTRATQAAPTNDIKTAWAHELSGFAGNLAALAWALENLPEKCPNVIVFKNLCRQAPAAVVPMLPSPTVDPVIAAMVIEGARKRLAGPDAKHDPKAWADRILERHASGEKISPTVVQMARSARPVHA